MSRYISRELQFPFPSNGGSAEHLLGDKELNYDVTPEIYGVID